MAGDTWHIMIIIIWIPCCYLGSGKVALKSMWKTGIIAFLGLLHRRETTLLSLCEINHWEFSLQLLSRWTKPTPRKSLMQKLWKHPFFKVTTQPCSRFVLSGHAGCFRGDHLEFKLRITTIRRRTLLNYQIHRAFRVGNHEKLSNASLTVHINSHLWLWMLPSGERDL